VFSRARSLPRSSGVQLTPKACHISNRVVLYFCSKDIICLIIEASIFRFVVAMACAASAAGKPCNVCAEILQDQLWQDKDNDKPYVPRNEFVPETSSTENKNCDYCAVSVPPLKQEPCSQCQEGVCCNACHWRAGFYCHRCMNSVRAPDVNTDAYNKAKHRLAKQANFAKRIHKMQRRSLYPYMPNCAACDSFDSSSYQRYANYCSVCGARNPKVVLTSDLSPNCVRESRYVNQHTTTANFR
jgi:hypothetical protein